MISSPSPWTHYSLPLSLLCTGGRKQHKEEEKKQKRVMEFGSWFRFRRFSLSRNNTKTHKPDHNLEEKVKEEEEQQQQLLGVTDQLIDFIKSFTLDTFKSFHLQAEEEEKESKIGGDDSPTTSANTRNDLSEWQERHALLVLSKVKEISQLRYLLCPRHFKERQFWRIYFMLVKNYVSEYELHAIRLAKFKRMALENETSSYKSGYEVEMAETKQPATAAPPTVLDDYLDSLSSGSKNGGADHLSATGGDIATAT